MRKVRCPKSHLKMKKPRRIHFLRGFLYDAISTKESSQKLTL